MCLTDRAGAILRQHTRSSQVKDTTVTAHWSAIGNGGGGEGEGEARDWARSCCCVRSLPCCREEINMETMFISTYLAFFQRAVRARRGDDARAERCLRVGCDKMTLRSVLGFHVADFPLVLMANALLMTSIHVSTRYQIVKLAAHA